MRRVLLASVFLLALAGCPTDLKDALRQYGYMPVRPASSMWRPGTMVYVKGRDPLEVGFICTASQMMGTTFAPLESVTSNADLARASKRGMTMAAQVQDLVSADSELQNIKSVKMHLRNVKVFELTDYDVAQAVGRANRGCLAAIARRRAQGFDVTLISGAIQADVTYTITWERSSQLDVSAKVAAAQNLSAKLGVQASAVNDRSIQATGLVWGVRDDAYLAYLFEGASAPPVDRGTRVIDPNEVAALEVMLAGNEPRSMPGSPSSEVDPLLWQPLDPSDTGVPTAPPDLLAPAPVAAPNPLAPDADPNGVAPALDPNLAAPATDPNAGAPTNDPNLATAAPGEFFDATQWTDEQISAWLAEMAAQKAAGTYDPNAVTGAP